jgi:Zn-dependent M28 family amino/carboxypeptidase
MKKLKQMLSLLLVIAAVCLTALFFYLRSPVLAPAPTPLQVLSVSADELKRHVLALTGITPPRMYKNEASMAAAETYVENELKKSGYQVRFQNVVAENKTYHNVIARFGPEDAKNLVVVGAHYDVAGEHNPGADDNASGVAVLLELAKLTNQHRPAIDGAIEFVVYTLEEPPFFNTQWMGSAVHAQDLEAKKINVKMMMSLEMLGYYSDEPFSQMFPNPLLYLFYPWKGNFISVVATPADRALTREVKSFMAAVSTVPVYSINAPAILPGIDFSDHKNYWLHGWPAVMITDTAFYRNTQYHQAGDTAEGLDYDKMSDVSRGLYNALIFQAR